MTDISKCQGYNMPECDTCYRKLAEAEPMYQSYIYPQILNGKCLDVWEVNTYREVDNPGDLLVALCSGEAVKYNGIIWQGVEGEKCENNNRRKRKRRNIKHSRRHK